VNDSQKKPDIIFPCRWGYKAIGADKEIVAEAVRSCLGACLGADLGTRAMQLEFSRTSAGGKYVSWNLNLRVNSLVERDELFAALSGHPDIKMVI
jgi:uncharacterized protein